MTAHVQQKLSQMLVAMQQKTSIECAGPEEVSSEPQVDEKDKDPFYIVYSMSGVD